MTIPAETPLEKAAMDRAALATPEQECAADALQSELQIDRSQAIEMVNAAVKDLKRLDIMEPSAAVIATTAMANRSPEGRQVGRSPAKDYDRHQTEGDCCRDLHSCCYCCLCICECLECLASCPCPS